MNGLDALGAPRGAIGLPAETVARMQERAGLPARVWLRTLLGTSQLASTGAYHKALDHVDGLIGRAKALGSMSWSVAQWANISVYQGKRDEYDKGWVLATQQGNEALGEAATNAQEALAELIERDYFDSKGTPKVTDVKTGQALTQEIDNKIKSGVKAVADKFKIPWWVWAAGGAVVLGTGMFFAWPFLTALRRRK